MFGEMAQVMPSLANITWERLVREDAVTYPCDAPDEPGNEIIFGDSFPTKSGRAKIVPADLVPPDELPDEAYPLVLTTGRLLEHWHTGSMTRRASNLDAMEPEAIAGLNPREMDKLGIEPGGFIRVHDHFAAFRTASALLSTAFRSMVEAAAARERTTS